MMTTETHTDKILNNLNPQGWTRIAELRENSGLTKLQFDEAILSLHEAGLVRLEAQPFRWRINQGDEAAAIMLGGEWRHMARRAP